MDQAVVISPHAQGVDIPSPSTSFKIYNQDYDVEGFISTCCTKSTPSESLRSLPAPLPPGFSNPYNRCKTYRVLPLAVVMVIIQNDILIDSSAAANAPVSCMFDPLVDASGGGGVMR